MNFAGNAVAITQQALWGRGLDYAVYADGSAASSASSAASNSTTQVARNISYSQVIKSSLQKDGLAAFFTVPKWASRILMNAPVQGSLPWFYNNVLPLGEDSVLGVVRTLYSGKKDESGKNENGCAIS